ncbi:MAG: HEAT repeat domain-containing protein [Planctomycetia bacterium]
MPPVPEPVTAFPCPRLRVHLCAPLRAWPLLWLAALALPVPARGAVADVVRTDDGLLLEGEVEREDSGDLRVTTPEGVLRVPAARVVAHEPGAGPRTRWRRAAVALEAAGGDAAAWYRLALEAAAQGLVAEEREALACVVAREPGHAAARRARGEELLEGRWVGADEARRARGLVPDAGRWWLPEELELAQRAAAVPAPALPAGSDVLRVAALLEAGLVGEPARRAAALRALSGVGSELRVAAALRLLGRREPALRAAACRELGRLGDEAGLRALVFHGARDLDRGVREAAVDALASLGHDDAAVPFVRALGSTSPRLVANAAAALARLGDLRAVHALVKRLVSHGSSARSFVSFTRQVSYVRDYDVELAQASSIANPQVGVLEEGVVLDIRVLDATWTDTWLETQLVDALARLSGERLAGRAQALAWYERAARTLPTFDDAPRVRRVRKPVPVTGAPG